MSLFCRHRILEVWRCHANCVPPGEHAKVLYVDIYDVWNFIRCTHCHRIFHTDQREQLHTGKVLV